MESNPRFLRMLDLDGCPYLFVLFCFTLFSFSNERERFPGPLGSFLDHRSGLRMTCRSLVHSVNYTVIIVVVLGKLYSHHNSIFGIR